MAISQRSQDPGSDIEEYETAGNVRVTRKAERLSLDAAAASLIDALDDRPGVLLASGYEYPGRYTRWDIGFVDPPLMVSTRGRQFEVKARGERGRLLLRAVTPVLAGLPEALDLETTADRVSGRIAEPTTSFTEEERSRQPSVFSVLRALISLFQSPRDGHLGLYGAFGYDLVFQFEELERRLHRPEDQRDLVLYLPDRLVVVDHNRQVAVRYHYEFTIDGESTEGMPVAQEPVPYAGPGTPQRSREDEPGDYADLVNVAKDWFRRGDLFEVVPSHTFYEPMTAPPSEVFRRLCRRNPAPFATLMNLGSGEYLVGASPEMFVRVDGDQVESCPISGTIARGDDPIDDADRILELLNSDKDASELTMCTDVDRNDKSRICLPGSVRVIGRRQIEMYSRVIHTVDHVEGTLREEFDALDAFLTHAWAVTVTGAPKIWAMRFIEEHEGSPRAWYGGAIGYVGFNGSLNTGLTLRTMRVKDGVAEVRAGGTLLIDSDPPSEERETELKAAALLDAIRRDGGDTLGLAKPIKETGKGCRVLLVDHEDSFVHTLANYLRQTGAEVRTLRAARGREPLVAEAVASHEPDLIVLSPGPGRPDDFGMAHSIELAVSRGIGLFGVCLGLQGIVEHFGGTLSQLDYPMHGKASVMHVHSDGHERTDGGRLFQGLPASFTAGRYHSLFADSSTLPEELVVTAETEDGLIMAVEHSSLPVVATQFHPESLLTLGSGVGLRLVANVLAMARDARV